MACKLVETLNTQTTDFIPLFHKQPKCPLTEEWLKKMWHGYAMEYYSAIKWNRKIPFAETWIDLETVIQSQKEKFHISYIKALYCILAKRTDEPICKTEIETQM